MGILICTHGNSAKELLQSAEMICGTQKDCQTVKFEMGESLDQLQNDLKAKLDSLQGPVLCLTDLKGGTPFNTLVKLIKDYPDMEIVTGVNIPMLLQLFINREQMPLEKLLDSVIEAGQTGIYRYSNTTSGDNEEF
ncbi:PTS sugar transporter subunit IIA [Lactobacillus sp. ESL0684]|uniref:PTS sugar transporter subunit IIA n=1 Tax=Lactobacillus sp. ESL0684 TaxID=2983213 RepID=UPI0023F94D50|nr:PTS sugar transporter subunit IIA [Lactobacillus sp. ESL0684]WEV43251.1 PTS sugar transporter subunit IIA [Lactobacillus sp. ESL0684]